jgi:hypothetical protein
MREIKFRTYNKKSGVIEYETLRNMAEHNTFHIMYDDYEWMQYTGLKDKNGKEIYEGDLVRYGKDGMIGKVEWDYAKTRWRWSSFPLTNVEVRKLTIIGNIYENPELIK